MKPKRHKLLNAFRVLVLCCVPVLWLLRNAVHQNVRNLSLLVAIDESDAPTAHRLLEEGADANATDQEAPSTFPAALRAWRERLSHRHLLPQKGVSTALILALENKAENPLIVKDLLAYGADPNQTTASSWTPLMVALSTDRQASARELLARGARVNVCNSNGMTPLMTACYNGNATATMKQLIALGADVNAKDIYGDSVLTWAANGNDDCSATVQALIAAGANVNIQGQGGRTALITAAFRGQAKTVRILLAHGANIHVRNKGGDTPLRLAQGQRASQVVALLKDEEAQQRARQPQKP